MAPGHFDLKDRGIRGRNLGRLSLCPTAMVNCGARFRGGFYGFLQQTNLSFPSGHTILAFSTAACLAYLCPRGRCVWFFAASLVAFERVAEAAHYPSDVVGAAMLGIFSSHTAQRLMRIDSFAQSISTSIPYANPDPTPETDRPSPGADDGRSISNN